MSRLGIVLSRSLAVIRAGIELAEFKILGKLQKVLDMGGNVIGPNL